MSEDTEAKEEKKQGIKNLLLEIKKHQNLYYNQNPIISDEEFDALWDRLRSIDPHNKIFTSIGSDSSFFAKLQHIMPMGSLDKASDNPQFLQWAQKHEADYYVVQHKLDGASLELQYSQGSLHAAVTRGDGSVGDDILVNARNMKGVPKDVVTKLSNTYSFNAMFAVRGEVIMTHDVHKKHFSDKVNCRNAANGLMKRKDGVGVSYLEVICYDIWFQDQKDEKKIIDFLQSFLGKDLEISIENKISEVCKIKLLKIMGFDVVPYVICKSAQEVCRYRQKINTARSNKNNKIKYDIDGLVIKMPVSYKDDMYTLRPDRQIAFKFPLEQAVTTLEGVEWSESGHLYTPVALLAPVRIAGTTVRRASLVHSKLIKELNIKIGSEVIVAKRGEIIPKVEKVLYTAANAKDIVVPHTCNICNSKIIDEGTQVYCPNVRCRKRLLFRVQRWINIMKIDHWGSRLLYKLVMEEKIVKKIGDLYHITADTLCALERIAMPLAKKLYTSLQEKKNIKFEQFIASIGIENVDLQTAKKIVAEGINNWSKFKKKCIEEKLALSDDRASVIARCIVAGIRNWEEIKKPLYEKLATFNGIGKTIAKDIVVRITNWEKYDVSIQNELSKIKVNIGEDIARYIVTKVISWGKVTKHIQKKLSEDKFTKKTHIQNSVAESFDLEELKTLIQKEIAETKVSVGEAVARDVIVRITDWKKSIQKKGSKSHVFVETRDLGEFKKLISKKLAAIGNMGIVIAEDVIKEITKLEKHRSFIKKELTKMKARAEDIVVQDIVISIRSWEEFRKPVQKKLAAIDGVGELTAKNIVTGIKNWEESKQAMQEKLAVIDGMGEDTANNIVAEITNWKKSNESKQKNLATIDGVGEIIAQNIINTCTLLEEELADVLTFVSISKQDVKGKFVGKSFCFTGVFMYKNKSIVRKDLQNMVEEAGGLTKTVITKDLSYLVTANKNSHSSKTKKAKEYGVQIIDLEDFFKLR